MHTALISSSFESFYYGFRPGKRRWLTRKEVFREACKLGLGAPVQRRAFWSFERAARNSSSDKGGRSNLSRRRTRARRIARQTQATGRRPSHGRTGKMNRRSSLWQTITASSRTPRQPRSEEHTSELQSLRHLVCRLLLEKKKHH